MTPPLSMALSVLFAFSVVSSASVRADDTAIRRDMADRAMQYLYSVQKEGALGDSRKPWVSSLFVLAALSSGTLPDDPAHGAAVQAACNWVLDNSSPSFFGGQEEPNTDHAAATLMLMELIGVATNVDQNSRLYQRAAQGLDSSLKMQDKGVGAEYAGGWRRNDQTRVNDRALTAWYLYALRSADLRGFQIPSSGTRRALEFMCASQKLGGSTKPDELGGFSVDAEGLPVLSTTAAGLASLALLKPDDADRIDAARDWLRRHPPRWQGPSFYDSNFFAVRALYRARHADGGATYRQYYGRIVRVMKERQDADGSFPFPPGHGGPTLQMGRAYSTAMAVLILNVDRGLIPMDR